MSRILLVDLQEFRDRHANPIALDDDFAPRHGPLIGEHQDSVVLVRVKFDDGAAPHP